MLLKLWIRKCFIYFKLLSVRSSSIFLWDLERIISFNFFDESHLIIHSKMFLHNLYLGQKYKKIFFNFIPILFFHHIWEYWKFNIPFLSLVLIVYSSCVCSIAILWDFTFNQVKDSHHISGTCTCWRVLFLSTHFRILCTYREQVTYMFEPFFDHQLSSLRMWHS